MWNVRGPGNHSQSITHSLGCCLVALLLAALTGCPQPANNNGGTDIRTAPFLDVDGNFRFDTATAVTLTEDQLVFSGKITGSDDVDLFKLAGVFNPGDRIVIDIQRDSGNLDAVAALFDTSERLVAYNDDRNSGDLDGNGADRNPRIDIILPGDESLELVLGVAQFADSSSTGDYVIDVQVQRDVGPVSPTGQIVFLDYRGGPNITIPNVGTFNLPPFDAASAGASFAGHTDELTDLVEATVKERYSAYNLVVLNSNDFTVPGAPHSTIYFGGFNQRAFAISEKIDTLNQDLSDDAILFTRSFDDAFSSVPTLEDLGTAIGNTVAHEIGHLLGLVHTADCDELMDSTCGNNRILSKQVFGRSSLDPFVFPVGTQDARVVLEWVLGLIGL